MNRKRILTDYKLPVAHEPFTHGDNPLQKGSCKVCEIQDHKSPLREGSSLMNRNARSLKIHTQWANDSENVYGIIFRAFKMNNINMPEGLFKLKIAITK